jgi:signal transduction histidine kinase
MAALFSALHLRSLRVQVLLWTIAPLIILLIVFSLTGLGAHQASMRQLAADENTRLLQMMANSLASQVASKTTSMQAAAELLGHDYADIYMRSSHLDAAGRVMAGSDLVLLDTFGSPLGAAPAPPDWLGDVPPAALLPMGGQATISLTVTHVLDQPTALWRVPVPGQLAWLVAGEPITALVQSSGLTLHASSHGGALVLADGAGRLLYHSGGPPASALRAAQTASGTAGAFFERSDGQDFAVAYAAVPGTDWRLVLHEPWHGLTTPPILLEQWTPFVMLIAVAVSFLTLLFGLLFVVRPLRLLGESTRRIGQGDFAAARAPVGGVDEIEELRQAVDQMAQQIQAYQAGLQSYLHSVTRAQEEERARLARELHDETIQTLTALDHKLQKVQKSLEKEPEPLRRSLDDLHTMVAGATAEVRRFSRALRPLYLEDLGLAPALELLAKESAAGFTLVGTPRRIQADVELALYRIAQESLSNARKHAGAQQVEVTLAFAPQQVRLTVSDDGVGFNLPGDISALARSGHFGLMGMHERAQLAGAQLLVETEPQQGTAITVTAPTTTPAPHHSPG